MELLENWPYKDKLVNARLFLKTLQGHSSVLTNLISPRLGGKMTSGNTTRMTALFNSAPTLERQRVDQVAALPIGSRIKLDPWSNQLSMMNANPVALVSAREKMPFEVTPFFPYLSYSPADKKLVAETSGNP